MTISFSELWELCEQLNQNSIKDDSVANLIDKLLIQINLYKTIDLKEEIPIVDRRKIKSRTYGEILLTLTNLSLKEDINVFKALLEAYQLSIDT